MLLETDQDIQHRFSNLLDGEITKNTLLAFGGAESTPDDGFQSYTVSVNARRRIYTYWKIEYRDIKFQFKFVEVHKDKDEDVESYILLTDERKISSMRQLFETIDKFEHKNNLEKGE